MGLRMRVAGGVAALASGALPLIGGVGPAAADDFFQNLKTFDHTFQDLNGQPKTCPVSGGSSLARRTGQSTFTADSFMVTFGEGCVGAATLSITYRDGSGTLRRVVAGGDNGVSVTVDGVRDGWVASHTIMFDDCTGDCSVVFTTNPK